MEQSKRHSALEAGASTGIAFIVALAFNWGSMVAVGAKHPFSAGIMVTIGFTILSFIRQYYVRRLFNHLHKTGRL